MEQISDPGVSSSNQQKNTKAVFNLLEVKNNTQQKGKNKKGGKVENVDEGKSSIQKLMDAKKHNAEVEKIDQDAINQMIRDKMAVIDG
jgi:hypothetical protein